VSPVKYELGFYIPEDDILHGHRRGNRNIYYIVEGFCSLRAHKNEFYKVMYKHKLFVLTEGFVRKI
jgi:hypothetical protein